MNVTLRQLNVFLTIAQVKSFTRAGDTIGLTQSAVSRCLRELESELGLKLIDRTTREVDLTDTGKRLAASIEHLLEELNGALAAVHGVGEQRQGKVRVATSPTISASLMPGCITACAASYPDITLILRDQVQSLVLDSVRNGEVDFGVVIEPKSRVDLECEPIMVEPFYLICRSDHALAQQTAVQWTQLKDEKLVLLDHASGSRQLIDRALEEHQVQHVVAQELGHSTTVFRMVEAGIGISVLPALSLPLPEPSVLVLRPLLPQINRTLMLVRRKNRSLSPVAELVWRLIAALVRQRQVVENPVPSA